ncbi:capsule assembly Wzi family protein [Cognatishimia sp. D5M38]|uniref:Capsule assembly Wzi family protein n=1 Tax=Cognatishimia coralii TaxID=3083254 RepID=A0ABU8QKY0_9RHOB
MRRLLTSVLAVSVLTPAFAQAEGSFSLATGALSGGFLTQQDHYGFGAGKQNSYANLAYEDNIGDLRYRLSVGIDSDDSQVLFDDSYVERDFGLWTLGAGAKDWHWGPSRYTSLVLSDNTRPVPGVYVSRAPSEFESPWLSWLGEWSGDILVGQLAEHTAPADTKLLGMRLDINPLPGLEVEFVRMVEFGGDGRDNSAGTFLKILSGFSDANSVVSNQLAGFGVSYTLPETPLRGYVQAIGEDEAGYLPSCYFYLAGLEYLTNIAGSPSIITLEAVDTRVKQTPAGFCGPNTVYTNTQYASGYSHYGATLGAPIDTEGTSMTLFGKHELRSFDLRWSIGQFDINQASLATHRLTPTRTKGILATVGATKSWDDTTLSAVVAYQDFNLREASRGVSFGMQLSKSF